MIMYFLVRSGVQGEEEQGRGGGAQPGDAGGQAEAQLQGDAARQKESHGLRGPWPLRCNLLGHACS